MSEEDIDFLMSIQGLEQPDFDNAYLERENERLRNQLQQKENIIKEVREKLLCYGETFDLKVHQQMQKELLEILDEKKL